MAALGYIVLGILAAALVLLALALYIALVVVIASAVAVGGGAVLGAVLLGTYLRAAQRVLAPRRPPADDPLVRLPLGTDGEPAYRSYYAGQVIADMRSVITQAWTASRRAMRSPAVRGMRRWLLTGRPQPGLPVGHLEGLQLAFTVPAGMALGVAAAIGILAAVAAVAAIQLIHALFLAAITASLASAAIVLRAADAARLAISGIRMKCPYPGCYARIIRPSYRCSSGQHEHRKLTPGHYGVLWRTCACGERLPTMIAFKLHQRNASCPACNRPVPSGLGSAPLIHLPLVGGTNAGKTALLTAIVDSLLWLAALGELAVEFAADASRRDHDAAKALLRTGNWPHATAAHVPHAFLLYVQQGAARRRLVYLYDPRGEVFQETDSVRELEYLDSAGGIIFVIDPFAAQAARHLPAADAQVGQAARPSPDDPDMTYARITGELRDVLGRRCRRVPVAVVATKLDAVEQATSLPKPPDPGDTEAVAAWLAALGLVNLTLSLGLDFTQVRYWATSAYASSGPRSAPAEAQRRNIAAPLLWLLSRQ